MHSSSGLGNILPYLMRLLRLKPSLCVANNELRLGPCLAPGKCGYTMLINFTQSQSVEADEKGGGTPSTLWHFWQLAEISCALRFSHCIIQLLYAVKSAKKQGTGWLGLEGSLSQACGCVFTPFLLTFASLSLSICHYLSLSHSLS